MAACFAAGLVAPAVVAAVLIVGLWRRVRRIDDAATIPQVEIQLLRSLAIFASLPPPSLEGMARELVPVTSRRVSRRCLGVHSLCILPAAQYWRPYAMMALVFVPGGQYWMVQSRTP